MLSFACSIIAQQLERSVVSTSGGHANSVNSDLSVHWSLGELATSTLGQDIVLTQGFHQLDILIDPIYEWSESDIVVSIYPNPTAGVLKLEKPGVQSFNVQLRDLYGRIMLQDHWRGPDTEIDLHNLPDQTYILTLASENVFQSYQIVKARK